MSPTYTTPGVYIEEITGPGVITGVGTSTAAFVGPAAAGPLLRPTVITTFDDFIRIFGRASDGWPYLVALSQRYYLGHAVQGFFENGGTRAVIVRVGSAKTAVWSIVNRASAQVFQLEALAEGSAGNGYKVEIVSSSAATPPQLASATATIATPDLTTPKRITVTYADADSPRFIVGDSVELVNGTASTRNYIVGVSDTTAVKTVLTLENSLLATSATTIRMAPINDKQRQVRVVLPAKDIHAGGLVRIDAPGDVAHFSIVEGIDADGFVSLRFPFQLEDGSSIPGSSPIDISGGLSLRNLDFGVKVTSTDDKILDEEMGLSLDPFHPGYVYRRTFNSVRVLAPTTPPGTKVFSQLQVGFLPQAASTIDPPVRTTTGVDDEPSSADYDAGLKALEDVDDVSIVCVPDAASNAGPAQAVIQKAAIDHCTRKHDRIAVLDVPAGRFPANDPSALSHRTLVPAPGGFAALYYPWLLVPEPIEPRRPRPLIPQSIAVPPSGHIAGVYARVDQTLGVHHPPANVEVRGVMGLERVISDREQGLINLEGVNALRIFPGDGRVVVWGARTTGLKEESDWIYVNVRRLMLYIEESIEEGIRWAVFKPNDRPLWQSLKRTIGDFLERVWKDGGLAGKTRDQAYQVRIDEGLNVPSDIAKGRLYIEIRVAPVRPAEFIIVRIGLWDGGAEVVEN